MLEHYPNYWDKGADPSSTRSPIQPIVDATVRLANLKSGQLDFIERVAPADMRRIKRENRFKLAKITELGYQGITINTGKSDLAKNNPLGKDPRVREAFELSLDRAGIVQVAMDGEADVGNQWVSPDQRLLRQERAHPQARRRPGQGAAEGGGGHQSHRSP